MKYKQIAKLLNGISETFDWDKLMEGDNIIGLKQSNFRDFTVLSCKQRKAYHWNQEADLSLVVHLLKLYIKLVLRLIYIITRLVFGDIWKHTCKARSSVEIFCLPPS